jgi:hypothetical protein
MNIAMGGTMGSDPQYETGGLKNGIDPALNSARMEIDYVRVYQYPTSVDDPTGGGKTGKLFVSPNPAEGKVLIESPFQNFATGNIYNLHGKNVLQFTAGIPTTEIDLSTLPKGLYCITLQSERVTYTNKLIIK